MTVDLLPPDWRDWPVEAKQRLHDELRKAAHAAVADDPNAWILANLKTWLWSGQKAINTSIRDNRYTVVPSSHDVGKTFDASAVVAWWIATKDDPFVITSAPTAVQVSTILWREIGARHEHANLPGYITRGGIPQWKLDGGRVVGMGRKPTDYSQAAFQGLHSLNPLVVFDEADGIPPGLWDQADAIMTNDNARFLAIGNPVDPHSRMAEVARPSSGWNVIRLDGLRSPNMTATNLQQFPELAAYMAGEGIAPSTEKIPKRLQSLLVSPQWINERMTRWGTDSALWKSRVRGIWPDDADDRSIIPLAWAQAAVDRWHAWNETQINPPGRGVIGVDVARSIDGDETVMAVRHAHVVHELETWRRPDLTEVTGRVAARARQLAAAVVVDETGVGAGVLDRLREQAVPVSGHVAAGKPPRALDHTGEFGFRNARAEAWWRLREALDPQSQPNLCLPPDEQLLADMTAPRWELSSTGKITVESKDDIRKRLGRSTDRADAVILTLQRSDMAGVGDTQTYQWGQASPYRDNDDATIQAMIAAWQGDDL